MGSGSDVGAFERGGGEGVAGRGEDIFGEGDDAGVQAENGALAGGKGDVGEVGVWEAEDFERFADVDQEVEAEGGYYAHKVSKVNEQTR